MNRKRALSSCVAIAFVALASIRFAAGQKPAGTPGRTQVVMLGTGTPRPDPQRSGPATAIVVGDMPYLVDAGPGIVRRAQAAYDKGITALAVTNLRTAFITHLHSDHTVGYPDLIFTTWVQGRKSPLRVFGPAGTEAMTRYIMLAWQADIDIRSNGLERRNRDGVVVDARDVQPGLIFQDANVKVMAFSVAHGEWPQAFGYRFDTADRSVVVSGDTSPSEALIQNCQRCDVLVHEVFSDDFRPADMPNWPEYRSKYHTTATQLAEIANKTRPGLLILYHRGSARGKEQDISDIQRTYRGRVAIGQDLDVF